MHSNDNVLQTIGLRELILGYTCIIRYGEQNVTISLKVDGQGHSSDFSVEAMYKPGHLKQMTITGMPRTSLLNMYM